MNVKESVEHAPMRSEHRSSPTIHSNINSPSGLDASKPSTGGNGGVLKLDTTRQLRELNACTQKLRKSHKHGPTRHASENEASTIKDEELRLLGEKPCAQDLAGVTFKHTNKFTVGDVVIIARTRGGFSYGKVTRQGVRKHCFLDASRTDTRFREWRVVYPNFNHDLLFKDLPALSLGFLPRPATTTTTTTTTREEGGEGEEEVDGETITFAGVGSTPTPTSTPTSTSTSTSSSMQGGVTCADMPPLREIGREVLLSDLEMVDFAITSSFKIDEVVVVPRSAGGFTYGLVLAQIDCPCPFNPQSHRHSGWRILTSSPALPARTVKDLLSLHLGKLHLVNMTPLPAVAPVPAVPRERQSDQLPEAPIAHSEPEQVQSQTVDLFGGFFSNLPSAPVHTNLPPTLHPNPKSASPQAGLLSLPDPIDGSAFHASARKKRNKSRNHPKPTIVLDGPNIAMKHGKQKVFSVKGIETAAKYFTSRGHDVIAFIPQHYASKKPPTGALKLFEFMPAADDLVLLNRLVDKGLIVLTPSQDYDDSYCIQYARSHRGCIVTNDLYRDYVEKQPEAMRGKAKRWVREHCISFTFVRDEFLPNPDFVWPSHAHPNDPDLP